MDAKKLVMASVAGAVTLFVLGGLFYVLLLEDFFTKAAGDAAVAYRQEPLLWSIFLGELANAVLVTVIFGRWASIKTFMGGVKGGAVIGLLMGLGIALIFYGTTTLGNITSTLADALITVIRYGIAGGVIGWVLGRE